MYSNVYGLDGVTKLIQILKSEILADAAQVGIADFKNIPSKIVSNKTAERARDHPILTFLSSTPERLRMKFTCLTTKYAS